MSEIVKSRWESDGDTLRISMPLQKIDQQRRLVSGWATLDNIDTQGDIVSAEASKRAFARARGNLREMHQPIAVGKIVDFREDEFYDAEDGRFYRGIFVTARVSEGAEDTWHKVLDGTLTGFSIGGAIIDATNEMSKDGSNQQVRIIKDYDLVELSLVDNPANQRANITGFQKNIFTIDTDTGSVTKGMVTETLIENVFICKKDGEIRAVSSETATCLECGEGMENIGWFESGKDRAEKVREIVQKFKTPNTPKGGGEMTEEITKAEEAKEEVEEVTETPTTINEDGETTSDGEEAAEEPLNEVVDEEETISKKIDEFKGVVVESLEKTRTETEEAVKGLEGRINELRESFLTKASELEDKFKEFDESLTTEKKRLADMEKRLDTINKSVAVKKSAELENPVVTKQKNTTWDGAFSIDNLR